jgi:hypothetical protein
VFFNYIVPIGRGEDMPYDAYKHYQLTDKELARGLSALHIDGKVAQTITIGWDGKCAPDVVLKCSESVIAGNLYLDSFAEVVRSANNDPLVRGILTSVHRIIEVDNKFAIIYDRFIKMAEWHSQGTHRFYRETDLVFFEVHGPFTLADAQCMFDVCEGCAQEYGYVLSAFDNRDGPGMTPEARRFTSERSRERPVKSAVAVIGASLAVRTMSFLLMNVMRLAGKPVSPVLFCSTQEEAMAWLAGQRQHLRVGKK